MLIWQITKSLISCSHKIHIMYILYIAWTMEKWAYFKYCIHSKGVIFIRDLKTYLKLCFPLLHMVIFYRNPLIELKYTTTSYHIYVLYIFQHSDHIQGLLFWSYYGLDCSIHCPGNPKNCVVNGYTYWKMGTFIYKTKYKRDL